jgi:hypothetical protein
VWIPAVAAGIAAVESLHHFDATAARLAGANSSLTQLKNLRIWWQSLSLTQQSLPHNKQELVEVTEDAIQDELAAWTSGASNHRTGFYLPAVLSPVLASFCFVLSLCGDLHACLRFRRLYTFLSRFLCSFVGLWCESFCDGLMGLVVSFVVEWCVVRATR